VPLSVLLSLYPSGVMRKNPLDAPTRSRRRRSPSDQEDAVPERGRKVRRRARQFLLDLVEREQRQLQALHLAALQLVEQDVESPEQRPEVFARKKLPLGLGKPDAEPRSRSARSGSDGSMCHARGPRWAQR
jgi:hypothetical protein